MSHIIIPHEAMKKPMFSHWTTLTQEGEGVHAAVLGSPLQIVEFNIPGLISVGFVEKKTQVPSSHTVLYLCE